MQKKKLIAKKRDAPEDATEEKFCQISKDKFSEEFADDENYCKIYNHFH